MLGEIGPAMLQTEEIYRFNNEIIDRDGHERWDIESIISGIITGINKAASAAGNPIGSIGMDGWGVDFALLDKSGELTGMPVAYRDKRTEGMEKQWQGLMSSEETFRRSGINFYLFNTLFQLLSFREHAELASASRLLFLPSYVLYRICGVGVNELTISSTSQMLNTETGTWDPVILDKLGIPPAMLGRVCDPGTILGKVNHPDLNMPGTDAIAVCGHDTASAVVSVPIGMESSVYISTGTWCIVGIESEQPILSDEALHRGFTNERGYGGTYRFLNNIVGLWMVQGLIKSLPVDEDYEEIELLASRYTGSNHLVNPEDPLFYNPDDMKEAFDEYYRKTGQELPSDPGGYFRSAYDSLIYSFRDHIEMIENMTGREIRTIHLIGGGCQSAYLTRQTAAICNRKVVSGPVEAATTGNMLVQAIARGILPDLAEARKLVLGTMSVTTIDPPGKDDSLEAGYRKFLALKKA
jgi:rhamnulokinase